MTRSLLALSLLLGTPALAQAPAGAPASEASAPDASVTPTAEQEAVYRALSVRHESLSCAELDAMSQAPLDTYLYLIEHAEQPAWVGMRAARCVMQNHAQEALPELQRWVTSPDTRGLAILAVAQLDTMPLDIARDLATRALTDGPDPDGMRKRIARSDTPEIAALAELPVVQPVGE